jgi:hypothetical protein
VLRNGRFTTLDIPNSVNTEVGSLNDNDDIVDVYLTNSPGSLTLRSNVNEFIGQNSVADRQGRSNRTIGMVVPL